MSNILYCPYCGHHLNVQDGETNAYCPVCDMCVETVSTVDRIAVAMIRTLRAMNRRKTTTDSN